MSDLVERLRTEAEWSKDASSKWEAYSCETVLMEAADEIVRLQRELAEAKRQIDFGIHQSDLDRIGVNARRQAFLEAAEIASTATVHVSYGTLSMERDEPIAYRSLIAAALRAKAEETHE